MTQTDLNTPAAGAAPEAPRKRAAKAKTAAAKPAPAPAAPADEAPKPGLTSSQAELQEVQPDSAGQEPLPAAASEENRPALDEVQTQADEPAEPQPSADVAVNQEPQQPVEAATAAEVRKEAVIAKRDDALLVIVKNEGFQTIFEPLSKTSIGPGETAEIRCSTGQFKRDVLNNLKQFIGLGKKLEIRNA